MNTYQAYQTLNVDSDSSFEEVKYAYRKLALELHPDKNNNEKEGKKFKKITDAYHFLKNNQKKVNKKPRNPNSKWTYTDKKTKNEETFSKKRPKWEPNSKGSPPEEDWSKFTKEFEQEQGFWKEYEKEFWKNYDAHINEKFHTDKNFFEEKKNLDPKLFTEVDPSLCIACLSCETIAPDVFIIDKLTKMNPKSRVHTQNGASFRKIMDAAETCPTKAINVEEKESGKKLFPR